MNTHNKTQEYKQKVQDWRHRSIAILRDIKLSQCRHVSISKRSTDGSIARLWFLISSFAILIEHVLILSDGIEGLRKSNDTNDEDEEEVDHVPDDDEDGFDEW